MMPFLFHLILFLISSHTSVSHSASAPSESQSVKVVVSERCVSDPGEVEGHEVDLTPGSPLVLTHRIRLVPGPASGLCCQPELGALRERIQALEREVSELREKCGGLDGGCCTSQQSKGAGCSTVRPPTDKCSNNCHDRGHCVDGTCVCFPGFSGPDCSVSDCSGDCNNKGKCVNGKCVCDPGYTGPDCSIKTCLKNCTSNGRCVNGRCVCSAGFTGTDCSTIQCPENCNNKGQCVDGKCVCNTGFTGPDCSKRACPGNCNKKAKCVDGKCVCSAGFTGPDCSERSCPGNCNSRGRCVKGKCFCNGGFTGPDCSERSCPGNCNKKGKCVDGKCVCNAGFTGLDCSERSCPRNCSSRGRCVNGKCFCDGGFTGPDCSERSCPRNCNNKGRCVDGVCVCNEGFTGPDCSERPCPGNCNNKGRCVNGQCVCDTGFTGPDCFERSCPNNCDNKGMCVNGQCVCKVGFTGQDCSIKACPNNCNNKGRCVNGQCVCDPEFTGPDCSERSCPNNCNNKGRCVNRQCVCDPGFTGPDCSERSCPNNCNNKGRCVNGQCVCDPGFTGPDCSERSCPNNCSNKGRCVNGQCVCDPRFMGPDCSERSCPNNCNSKGRCVNGQCVCEVGFTGQDCSIKACPNNCSNRGRCVNGQCVCNPGFAEPDCSKCKEGFTGPACATALIAVPDLRARNITESSVSLFWTQPTVRYNTYYITFTSEKESDQITSTVSGGITTYTQVGLAPGHRYTVTITGEKNGKMGAKSTTAFQTLISGPKNLQVVKTSTTSVIVQWEEAQGNIDRYILSVKPTQTDGSGNGKQEMKLAPGRDSAQIDGLEPGQPYDVSLVAEKDGARSLPASVQATPDRLAGYSGEVRPVDGKRPTLQGGRFEENPVREDLHKETHDKTATFSEQTKRMSIQEGESGTSSSPSLPLTTAQGQTFLVPLETWNQPSNKRKASSGSRHHTETSLQVPPSSKYRYSDGSKLPSQKTMGSQPDDQDLQTNSGRVLNMDSSVAALSEGTTNTKDARKDKFPKQTEMKNKTAPPYLPHKGLFPRRHNNGPVLNRTSTFAHPYRSPLRRPIIPRFKESKNKVQPEAISSSQSVFNLNHTEILSTWQGQNNTVIGLLPKPKTKPNLKKSNSPRTDQIDTNTSTELNTVFPVANNADPRFYPSWSRNKAPQKTDDAIRPGSVGSGNILTASRVHELPRFTNRDSNVTVQLFLNEKAESNITSQRKNPQIKNPRSKFIRRKDGTIVRLQPIPQNQIKPKGAGITKEPVTRLTRKQTTENNYTIQSVPGGSEPSIDNILHSITDSDRDSSRIINAGQVLVRNKDQDLPNNTSLTIKEVIDGNMAADIIRRKGNVLNQNLGPKLPLGNTGRFQPKLQGKIKQNSTNVQGRLRHTGPRAEESSKEPAEVIVPSVAVGSEGAIDTPFIGTNRDNSSGMQIEPEFKGHSQNASTANFTTTLTVRVKNGPDFRHMPKPKTKPNLHGDMKPSKESSTTRHTVPQNALNYKPRPNLSWRRKNGTIVRPPQKVFPKLRPNFTTVHNSRAGSRMSTANSKLGWTTEVPLSTDKTTSEKNSIFPTAEVSEDGIGQVGAQNVTSKGFSIIWVAPEGKFKNFVITLMDKKDEVVNKENGSNQEEKEERNEGSEIVSNVIDVERRNSSSNGASKKVRKVLPGSARSYPVTNLTAHTSYLVTLYGTGPGLRSNVHTIVITTESKGPEPPSHLSFSDIKDTSLTLSWKRPKSSVSGFKVTYIHTKEGEPISVTVNASTTALAVTKLSPGSSYDVSIISVLGLDESDPVKDFVITLPDPPTDLRAINITDTKALLLWRPALAAVDQYIITYRSEEDPDSELRVSVSGNALEQQLQALKPSTKYRVTIISRLGEWKSSSMDTTFTTAHGKGAAPRDLTARDITARTAVLSWKPPTSAVTSYKLTYFTKGGEPKEVTLRPGVTEHKLRGLRSSSPYTVQLQGERGGVYTAAIYTEFTTGALRFPYPSDCSQEQMNGLTESDLVEIFPGGKQGQPVMVYCDMETDGGGWTVFQRRKDGKTDFFKSWQEYRKGFGDPEGEFWLGNDFLHNLTTMTPMNMRVDLKIGDESVYAHYSTFSVDTMKKHYMLRVSGYSGTAGDSLKYHDKRPFSTFDRDPQPFITRCAMSYRGGWWYKNCHEANLNGLYNTNTNHQGVIWTAWKGKKFSIPFTEMKLRPASYQPHPRG